MDAQNTTVKTSNADGMWIYRVGGVAAVAIGVIYLVIIGLYALVGVPPVGGEARLEYLVGKTGAWWAIVGLSVFTNFLYVPVALALFFALKGLNRNAMLIGSAFIGLFVILENAVNWTIYGALILLSQGYASAINQAQKVPFVAAATFASAVLESPLAAVWAIGTLSFGFLIIGFVMLKGVFSKITAYLGILTGILGIAAVAGVGIAVILNALFATIWLFFVGYRLLKLDEADL